MAKALIELTDRDFDRAYDRTWRKHFEYVEERNRRQLIERYGADNPELNVYTVELSIDCGTVTVKAKNPEEAEQIARDEIYFTTDNSHQIEFDDGPGFAVESVEEAEAGE